MDAIQRQLVGMDYFASRSVLENEVYESGRAEPIKPVPKPGEAVQLRFAASLLICVPKESSTKAQNEEDYEVLIQLRGSRGFFGSLTVFPGGGLDASDGDPAWRNLFLKSIAKSPTLTEGTTPETVLHEFTRLFPLSAAVAALRETFEEVGALLTVNTASNQVSTDAWKGHRDAVYKDPSSFLRLFSSADQPQPLPLLPVPWHHFVTPATEPTRYSARFLLTTLPSRPSISADGSETVTAYWSTPTAALNRLERGEIRMVEPQFLILKELQLRYPKWADLAAYSTYQTWRSPSEVADTVPETYRDPDTGMEVLTAPGDWLHSETPASESTLEAKPRNRVVLHPATGEGMGGNLSIYGRLELDRSIPWGDVCASPFGTRRKILGPLRGSGLFSQGEKI